MKISTIAPLYNFENGEKKASVMYVYDLKLLPDFILLNLKNGASKVLVYFNDQFYSCRKSATEEKGYSYDRVTDEEIGDGLLAELIRLHDEANSDPKFPSGNSEKGE